MRNYLKSICSSSFFIILPQLAALAISRATFIAYFEALGAPKFSAGNTTARLADKLQFAGPPGSAFAG